MKKAIKVIPVFRTDGYEERISRNGYIDTCECCGRKINPERVHWVQMLETAEWTDEEREVKSIEGETCRSQGCFPVGNICYREIRRRLRESGKTRIVEI